MQWVPGRTDLTSVSLASINEQFDDFVMMMVSAQRYDNPYVLKMDASDPIQKLIPPVPDPGKEYALVFNNGGLEWKLITVV